MAYDHSKIRLFVDAPLTPGAAVELAADHVHYMRAVMRQREGDRFHIFNGRDGEWIAELTALGKKAGAARLHEHIREQTSVPDLWLAFAPIKGARLDFVVQKATELGVAVLQPVLTERTVVRNLNLDRLRANAVEAAEQCECLGVPEIREPQTLRNLLGGWPAGRGLIFCDEGGDRPARGLGRQQEAGELQGIKLGLGQGHHHHHPGHVGHSRPLQQAVAGLQSRHGPPARRPVDTLQPDVIPHGDGLTALTKPGASGAEQAGGPAGAGLVQLHPAVVGEQGNHQPAQAQGFWLNRHGTAPAGAPRPPGGGGPGIQPGGRR